MSPDGAGWRRKFSLRALAGIQLGIAGGAVMMAFCAAATPLLGEPWWLIPNLFASALRGPFVFRSGAGWDTIIGISVHMMAAGVVGALAGIAHTGGRLFGVFVALACYLSGYFWLWKRIAPLLLTDAPQPVLAAGYFLYGSALGWHREAVKAHETLHG